MGCYGVELAARKVPAWFGSAAQGLEVRGTVGAEKITNAIP